mgnify:CR=1 FL=1
MRYLHHAIPAAVTERLAYELDLIDKYSLTKMFIIAKEIFEYARKRLVLMSERGMVGSLLVNYLLGITEINPLNYGLYFERFIPYRHKPSLELPLSAFNKNKLLNYLKERMENRHIAVNVLKNGFISVSGYGMGEIIIYKFDAFTKMKNNIELNGRELGVRIDLNSIPLDDPKTYQLLRNADTAGVLVLSTIGLTAVHPVKLD